MKWIYLISVLFFLTGPAFSQSKIDILSASSHYGEKVTICSKVYGTKALAKVTFIDLGAGYPNSLLTVVIFAKDRNNFKEAPDAMYNDKNICVTGEVKEYHGKPEIIVTSPEQITIQ